MTEKPTPQASTTGQNLAQYKAEVTKATEFLMRLGLMEKLDANADLVEAVREVIKKMERDEIALYDKSLDEAELLRKIAQYDEQIRQKLEDEKEAERLRAKIADYDQQILQKLEDEKEVELLRAKIADYDEQIRQNLEDEKEAKRLRAKIADYDEQIRQNLEDGKDIEFLRSKIADYDRQIHQLKAELVEVKAKIAAAESNKEG